MVTLKVSGFSLLESILAIAILLVCISGCITLIGEVNYQARLRTNYYQTIYLIDSECCKGDINSELSKTNGSVEVVKLKNSHMRYYRITLD